MNTIHLAAIAALYAATNAFATDCDNPCGPIEVLECAAQDYSKAHGTAQKTAEQFFDEVVFSKDRWIDKYCVGGYATTDLQKNYKQSFCNDKGTYSRYKNFLAAYEVMKTRFGEDFQFACAPKDSKNERYKELVNFLATLAQETKGGASKDTEDALYYRWEDQALQYCCSPDSKSCAWPTGPQPDILCNTAKLPPHDPPYTVYDFKTQYYPQDVWVLAIKDGKMFTKYFWEASSNPIAKKGNRYNLTDTPNTQKNNVTLEVPPGYSLISMNQAIKPGYWVGSGQIQLTLESMPKFMGWYYNTLVSPPVDAVDLQGFIKTFLNDGKLAWIGSFYYWMYRVNGEFKPTLHQILSKPNKPVCHDIAIVTRMVNAGCTHDLGRKAYYDAFLIKFGLSTAATELEWKDPRGKEWTLNSMQCEYKDGDVTAIPNPLEEYCSAN